MNNNKVIVYLDGSTSVKRFKKYHSYCQFLLSPYDSPTQRRKDVKWDLAAPSQAQWRDCNSSWEEVRFSWEEHKASEKLDKIYAIIGKDPDERRDGLHLDSAFKSGVHVFLTSDKGNIWNNRDSLEPLLGFRIFDPYLQSDLLIDFIESFITKNGKECTCT